MHRRIRSIIAVSTTAALLVGITIATAGPSGAIFTTNEDGSWVNGNVFGSAEAVYLNGGPRANQNCSAAGLPDGDYYFQVTDPSGKELLSLDDPGERLITVSGGVITGHAGSHMTSQGPCGLTVRLAPFGQTPNPGGEYKVWVTPFANYLCCGGAFGFFSSHSKTDNFKVQSPDSGDGD